MNNKNKDNYIQLARVLLFDIQLQLKRDRLADGHLGAHFMSPHMVIINSDWSDNSRLCIYQINYHAHYE